MIKEELKKNINTKLIGKNIIYYETIDSTQIEAKKLAENDIKDGTIVFANEQLSGIGTHDRKWHTGKENNLAFTMILYPKCNVSKLNDLTINIAEYMVDTIYELYNYKLSIKEPNDLMYNNKKVGGILTQIVSKRR